MTYGSADPSGLDLSKLNFDTILVRKSERGYNLLALADFLAMPVDERIDRWRALIDKVGTNTASHWSNVFLDRLVNVRPPQPVSES